VTWGCDTRDHRRARMVAAGPAACATGIEPRENLNIVNLQSEGRNTASDGESRVIGFGEDTTGKGHVSEGLGELRRSLFILFSNKATAPPHCAHNACCTT
jgi:hypothetical protein